MHATGLGPLASLVLVIPLSAGLVYLVQLGAFNRVLGKDILPPPLVSFGLSVILQNGLLTLFTVNTHKLDSGVLETGSFALLPGVAIGYFPLLTFAAAVGIILALQWMLYYTAH